jgi:predicted transcriptional regulator
MKPYCETVSQFLLPTMRALIAKNLMVKYKLTQQDVASKLGVTQSAISQYMRDLRGFKIKSIEKDENINKEIENFAGRIASGELNTLAALDAFCDICRSIRKKKLICDIHIKVSPELENCNVCFK